MEISTSALPGVASSHQRQESFSELTLSIVVPTRNEGGNIEPLLTRIAAALTGINFEVIFVDDSTDNTPDVIRQVGSQHAFEVTAIVRPPERRNGLGMAVVEGLRIARADWVVVMDGDLQHPPEVIRNMVSKAEGAGADLVVASRLSEGGSTAGLSWKRNLLSRGLALAMRLCFPKNLRHVSDPLTGFFLLRRDAIAVDQLRPEGFKILLEVMARNPQLNVTEVPFEFGKRHSGDSKASPQEMMRLLRQTLKLRLLTMQYLLRYLVVGASGIAINSLLLFVLTAMTGMNYLASAVIATQGSTLWNFGLTDRWVFGKRSQTSLGLWKRIASFFAVNNALLLVRGPILVLLVSQLGMNYLVANLVSLLAMTFLRFAISDSFIWGASQDRKLYYYNIHDIIRIRSVQRLPELGYFRTNQALDNLDFDIVIDRNPQAHVSEQTIVYDELPKRFGFSIAIDRSTSPIKVRVSPLVGKSPHVLYTNVVEPLLRWEFVRKDYALMHGACVAIGNQALFVTAQTDTGKTTTILQLIREHGGAIQFLSDDMSILSRDGQVRSFPKPLTISKHTLHAVNCSELTMREQMFLQVQSRLHSRGGRMFGMWLNQGFVPTATLNAIVQAIIPPPKYMVNRLIPGAPIIKRSQLSCITVIERGPELEREIDEQEKLRILLNNAEDAYGFPPYPMLAHELSSWMGEDQHQAEKEIVQAAIANLPAIHLRRSNYDWYQRMPALIGNVAWVVDAPIPVPALTAEILSAHVVVAQTPSSHS